MNIMHDKSIDLNLLSIFEAVMIELNVSRAAEQLNLTQPAVSHALRRLRRITNDELFIKVPGGVSPTPKALELWEPIRDGLLQIRQALLPVLFDPATAKQVFTIAMTDYSASLVIPQLLPILEQTAPHIDLRVVPSTHINATRLLEQSEIDIALVGRFFRPSLRLRVQELNRERNVCIMRRGHPLSRKKLTLKHYVNARHLLVSLTGEPTGFIDEQLREQGLKRRIMLTVNQFTLVPELIAKSDLITVIPETILQQSFYLEQLHPVELPLEVASPKLQMTWHERKQRDPAHIWLRSQLSQICQHSRDD